MDAQFFVLRLVLKLDKHSPDSDQIGALAPSCLFIHVYRHFKKASGFAKSKFSYREEKDKEKNKKGVKRKNVACESIRYFWRERSDDRKYVCGFRPVAWGGAGGARDPPPPQKFSDLN